jgi:hypothetical protein
MRHQIQIQIHIHIQRRPWVVIAVLLASSLWIRAADYATEVKPLLAQHCVRCHSAAQQKGGLRLDTAADGLRGGDHGAALTPGRGSASVLIQAIEGTHAEISRMPYKRAPLPAGDIRKIRAWIDAGALHPADEVPSTARHWAFEPLRKPAVPRLARTGRIADSGGPAAANAVDAFIRARLAAAGLAPSAEAAPATLLRRVTLDLSGLPPSPAEVQAFEAGPAPDRYERAVERLLASPHYGERWGRWWLDAARYGDSNGYSIDSARPMWPYRDWVVQAFNAGMPFDQFTLWQLAGDLLPVTALAPGTRASDPMVASGFHRNTQVNHEGGIDPEQFRVESVVDRVNTTATVWLGLTLACAQCHDHKFDPFTQREYYQLFAFFNSCENDGHGNSELLAENVVELSPPDVIARRDTVRQAVKEREQALDAWAKSELEPRQPAWEAGLDAAARAKLDGLVRDALAIPASERNPDQTRLVWTTYRAADPEWKRRRQEIDELRATQPAVIQSLVMRERDQPRDTFVLIKGDFTRPADRVTAAVPAGLHPFLPGATGARASRADLARWLTAPDNPLTARVIANRLWQQFFGRGLVETDNDFGTQGTPPTHPELLDWLATELIARGWDLKAMQRLIVTSATYRQTSVARADLADADPANTLLARQNRLRLDAEIVRDVALSASGQLDPRLGGPPVFPPQPAGIGAFTQNNREWKPSAGGDRFRRGIYTFLWRTTLHPALGVFDAADGYVSCTRRLRSNTPLQALTLLNDAAWNEFADALARRLEHAPGDVLARLRFGFRLCVGRAPAADELERLAGLLQIELRYAGSGAAWKSAARVLLNLDETITRE